MEQSLAIEDEALTKRRPTLRGIPDVVAFLFAVPAGLWLVFASGTTLGAFSAAAFSVGLALMLGTSGLYHAVNWNPRQLAVWSRLDHAAIFMLIGLSYTPFCLCTGMAYGRPLLAGVWTASVIGALHSLFASGAHRAIRATLFVLLGVAMVPNTPSLYAALPLTTFGLSLAGGAFYILGACIYVKRWPNPSPKHFGYHEVFHLFVFGGAICHYAAIWQIVT
jgi:hemolysin III